MIRFIVFCFAVLTLIACVFTDKIPFEDCEKQIKNCVIKELRMTPCKRTDDSQPCTLKKKKNGTIEVDFIPNFEAKKLHAYMYWHSITDIPLGTMEHDACLTTDCPTVPNQQQTYHYTLKIESFYPTNTYPVKFLLYGDDKEEQSCCMIFKMAIKK